MAETVICMKIISGKILLWRNDSHTLAIYNAELRFLKAKPQFLNIIKCNVPSPPKSSDYPFIQYLFSFQNHLPGACPV